MANNYKTFIDEYDKAKSERSKELTTLKANLAAAEDKRDKAQTAVDKAARGNSEATFRTAKVKLIECEADVEYYQGKISEVENSPLFDVSNETKLREIESLQKSIEDDAVRRVLVPITEAYNIASEEFDHITRLNEIAGEISGKGLNYYSQYFYRAVNIKYYRDKLYGDVNK